MLTVKFSKEMKYPESWYKKHEKDKEVLKNLEENESRRLEENEDEDGLKISVLTN